MNTKIAIGVLAALVVIGGGYYFLHGAKSPDGSKEAQGTEQPADANSESGGAYTGSFADLAARGGNWKCTIDSKSDASAGQAVSSGTVYVSGKNVRGDFATAVPNYGSVQSHMIADGAYVYSWSSVMPKGIKTAMAAAPTGSGAPQGGGTNENTSYRYDCEPSSADASLFTPPANVTFTAY